jgi:NTP pyrophosphatase (non-canonical NTP hydrolase)
MQMEQQMSNYFDILSDQLHDAAKQKGFYDELKMDQFNSQAKQLAMIHSEVTEVLEALRKSKGEEKVVEEIADILVRVFDFYGSLYESGVVTSSLDTVFAQKVKTNATREKMHGVLG